MRFALCVLSAVFLFLGCASVKPKLNPVAKAVPKSKTISVSPHLSLVGKVVSVNAEARFVVLDFPPGVLPALSQRLGVYHGEQKVGEIKVSGPHRDTIIVADITAGGAQVGDQVRAD